MNDNKEYEGPLTLGKHLFDSQASRFSWPGKTSGKQGIHCNTETWIRQTVPRILEDGKLRCPLAHCSFRTGKQNAFTSNLHLKHQPEAPRDLNIEHSMERVREYFRQYFNGFEMPLEFSNWLKASRDEAIARNRAIRA